MLNFSRFSVVFKCSMPLADGRIMQSFILESWKPLSTEQSFLWLYFFNFTQNFTALFGRNIHFLVYLVTHCLETRIISTCSLVVYFFLTWSRHILFCPCFQTLNTPPIFFVHFFLHFLFSRGVCTSVFTKSAVTRDLFDIRTSVEVCW